MKNVCIALGLFILTGLADPASTYASTLRYHAIYDISLAKVERPEKATKRYGKQKIDILQSDTKYKYFFEDKLVKILFVVDRESIIFKLENKTDYSIKIPWDEAAYVDKDRKSHRIIHQGVKYSDRNNPQPPTVIVRKGSTEDMIIPTDNIEWSNLSGSWITGPLVMDNDVHFDDYNGKYPTLIDFENEVKTYVGKSIQILLPLQIQDVINDYIFTFKINSVKTEELSH